MNLIGLMPVRNDSWILALSARVALMWADQLMILCHACDAETRRIASDLTCEYPNRAWVSFEDDPEWREMEHREHLLTGARDHGATHVAIVDADEILSGNLLPTIRQHVESTPRDHILQLPGYNMRGAIDRYHSNGIWGNRTFSFAFPDHRSARWAGGAERFHHREPFGVENRPYRPVGHGQGGIMHLWGASERRLIEKHKFYKITEKLRWPNKPVAQIDREYSLAIYEEASRNTPFFCKWEYAEAPASWWEPYRDLMPYLDLDAEPWQEAETRRLIQEHGAERFAGLDLFNVCEPELVAK